MFCFHFFFWGKFNDLLGHWLERICNICCSLLRWKICFSNKSLKTEQCYAKKQKKWIEYNFHKNENKISGRFPLFNYGFVRLRKIALSRIPFSWRLFLSELLLIINASQSVLICFEDKGLQIFSLMQDVCGIGRIRNVKMVEMAKMAASTLAG